MYSTITNATTSLKPANRNTSKKINIGIVDDHQIVIDGLTSLLKGDDKFNFAFATT